VTGSFTDPGTLDAHTVVISWGDGTPSTSLVLPPGVLTFSASHQYGEPTRPVCEIECSTTYTITATVSDDFNSASGTTQVTVNERGPRDLVLGTSAAAIDENDTLTIDGSFFDPDPDDRHTVVIDWGDGSPTTTLLLDAGVFTFRAGHRYLDDGGPGWETPYVITVTVSDDCGTVGGETVVTVRNVGPSSIAVSAHPDPIDENDTVTLDGTFFDPGTLDAHTVIIDWGDGSTTTLLLAPGVLTFRAIHQYLDDTGPGCETTFAIRVTVSDDCESAGGSTSVTVRNVGPSDLVARVNPSVLVDGGTTTLTGSFSDPGTLDGHTVEIDWGDGSLATVLTLLPGQFDFNADHTYHANVLEGASVFIITITVSDGCDSYSTRRSVRVVSVPRVQVKLTASPDVINENDTVTVNGSFTAPGAVGGHTVVIDWGDGSDDTQLNLDPGVFTFSTDHRYEDDAGPGPSTTYVITATVTGDAGSGQGETAATVNNVPPFAHIQGPGFGFPGQPLLFILFANDVSPIDQAAEFTYQVNWDDGSPVEGLAGSGFGTQAIHVFAHPGVYNVVMTATDKDGGVSDEARTLVVIDFPLEGSGGPGGPGRTASSSTASAFSGSGPDGPEPLRSSARGKPGDILASLWRSVLLHGGDADGLDASRGTPNWPGRPGRDLQDRPASGDNGVLAASWALVKEDDPWAASLAAFLRRKPARDDLTADLLAGNAVRDLVFIRLGDPSLDQQGE
jgi:hypothetical protein